MWIEELPNGKYKYVERYTDEVTGQVKRVSITHTKRNASAIKEMTLALQEKIAKKQSKHKIAIKVVTLSELIDEWLPVHALTIKGQSIVTRQTQSRIIKDKLGDYKTNKLNAVIINKYLLSLTKDGKAYSTVQSYKCTLASIVKFGAKYGYFAKDFSKELHIERVNVSEYQADKYLEHDEMRELLSRLESDGRHELARICKIQALTGMRIMELLALDYKEHIDLDNKTISVVRSYNSERREFTTPKNNKSRTIYINDDTVALIKEQIQHTLIKNMRHKSINPNNTLLFKTNRGTVINLCNLNRLLKKYPINNKVITSHYFRHTFITLMIENNVPFNLIAEQVGHSGTKMIEQVYKHFSQKMKRNLKQAVNEITVNF